MTLSDAHDRHPHTLRYAAPEVLEGEPVNDRSDVYAYGMLLYEIFSGNVRLRLSSLEPHYTAGCYSVSSSPHQSILVAGFVKRIRHLVLQAPWAQTFPQQIKGLVLAQKRPPMPADAKHGMPGLIQVQSATRACPTLTRCPDLLLQR